MFIDPLIPQHLADLLEQELEPGERLEWSGTPKPLWFDSSLRPVFLFAIPWTAFALFWTGMAFALTVANEGPDGLGLFFPLFGLPFVVIGIAMLVSPFWSARRKRNVAYAITDRRAIILQAGRSLRVVSFTPQELCHGFQRAGVRPVEHFRIDVERQPVRRLLPQLVMDDRGDGIG